MRIRAIGVALMGAVVVTASAWAHHSHGNYDVAQWTFMEGTVRQIVYIVPHSMVYLDVKNEKGEVAVWALEATNPQTIFGNGVKKDDVRTGDTIKVRCHVLRDGGRGCLLGFVTPAHGDAARGNGVERQWD